MGSDVVKRMVDAADAFLQALSTDQRSKARLDFLTKPSARTGTTCRANARGCPSETWMSASGCLRTNSLPAA